MEDENKEEHQEKKRVYKREIWQQILLLLVIGCIILFSIIGIKLQEKYNDCIIELNEIKQSQIWHDEFDIDSFLEGELNDNMEESNNRTES